MKHLLSGWRAILSALLVAAFAPAVATAQQDGPVNAKLAVQLSWYHQTQYAGFYLAQYESLFAAYHLDVNVLQGGSGLNPIDALYDGRADIAVSSFRGALTASRGRPPVTNIAQIFQGNPLKILCRASLGVSSVQQMARSHIGAALWGDRDIVRELVQTLGPQNAEPIFESREGNGAELIEGRVPCITGMSYNEYWKVIEGGVPSSDLVTFDHSDYGVIDFSDGLYVRTDRLKSAEFRAQLASFVMALEKGWQEARSQHSVAVEAVLSLDPNLDRNFQRVMLESVLTLIPQKNFGLFDLETFDRFRKASRRDMAAPDTIWTHAVWNDVQGLKGDGVFPTETVKFEVRKLRSHPLFKWVFYAGALFFSLSGCLYAKARGYNFWGCLLIAGLASLGGGSIRDLLIGPSRLPFEYTDHLLLPASILILVTLTLVFFRLFPQANQSFSYKRAQSFLEATGFTIIATNGACIALDSSMPWSWVPICAALSCTGGGLLRDIFMNEEPHSFKKSSFEEMAVLGSLVLLAGLWVAGKYENRSFIVLLSLLVAMGFMAGTFRSRSQLARYYPSWLKARR